MYARPSAPRSIGGVLDDAISLYRQSFPSIWPLTFIAALLVAVPGVFLRLQALRLNDFGPQAVLAMMDSPDFWLTYVVLVLAYMVVYGSVISALDGFAEHGRALWSESLGAGVKLVPQMLGLALALGAILVVGLMLLVVPGIYLWGIYQLAFVVLVVERRGISDAFGSSRRLIKGYWWRSTTIITIAVIIVLVFSVLVAVASGFAAVILGVNSPGAAVVQTLLSAGLNAVLFSLLPCFARAMYYDLRLRHEGGDLATRVAALAPR